ncbi:prolyl oligopeptidase family serine peptidase [Nocardia brasiliensis]|uniref:prolyl oligopeptidase family serine peptidase n=1 Tax=Nocardia brasiliensis TaxID=37326 RepID=UPI0024543D40|nr:prolyl oligopeptidase family serine peptidase [Nocardia brasiliensis]
MVASHVSGQCGVRRVGPRRDRVTHVTAAAPPCLLVHGDADTVVPVAQSERLADRLREAGVAVAYRRRGTRVRGVCRCRWVDQRDRRLLRARLGGS